MMWVMNLYCYQFGKIYALPLAMLGEQILGLEIQSIH